MFDLFIHLQSNDKYLLYTPRYFHFYTNQFKRLMDKGVLYLYTEESQTDAVLRYFTQIYLNQSIELLHTKKVA